MLLWREEMFSEINPLTKTIVVYDARFETLFRNSKSSIRQSFYFRMPAPPMCFR